MDTNLVKNAVIDGYGKLAKSTKNKMLSKIFACCDITSNATEVGKAIGYSQEELSSVPEDSNLGVGCGNPSMLTEIKEGETVIDLGSGAGFDAFIVSPQVGKSGKIIGIDLSEDMLKLAKNNARKGNYENVEFIKGDIEDLPLQDNLADHIISNCVINLSLEKEKVFKEAFRVLKKGGKMAISDIVLEKELPDVVKNSTAAHLACVAGAEKLTTYIQYIKDAGFQNIKIASKAGFPLELMLADPQLQRLANELNFKPNSEEAKEIASRVKSISLTAEK